MSIKSIPLNSPSGHVDVTLVRVNNQTAVISSYEARNLNKFITLANNYPDAYVTMHQTFVTQQVVNVSDKIQVLFEGISSTDNGRGCFVGVLNARE